MIKLALILFCASCISAHPNGRIIGGSVARAGQFPFAAAIYITTSDGTYFCTGTLISDQWILTSAQCLTGTTSLTIRLGTNSLSSSEGLRLATDNYFINPDYNQETLENDLGLIKLRLPLTFTSYVAPVTYLGEHDLTAGSAVLTFGWGQTSDEQAGLVDELNFVYITTLTTEECQLTFGPVITDNMVCAEGNYNEGTCRGDLGSPLIQYGSRGLTYIVGVSTFISTNGCESTDPSGFTRITPHVDWIRDTIANN